jgi:hypothetical protein
VIALGGAAVAAVVVVVVLLVARRDSPLPAPRADESTAPPTQPQAPPPTVPARQAASSAPAPAIEPPTSATARPRPMGPGSAAGAVHTAGGPPLAQPIRDRMMARLADPALAEARAATDPRAALAAYDRYLVEHPDGAAREQAMAGRATSLEALGERARAAAAWRAVAEAYPASMTAPNARRRAMALARNPR